jgi:hypothetical protein
MLLLVAAKPFLGKRRRVLSRMAVPHRAGNHSHEGEQSGGDGGEGAGGEATALVEFNLRLTGEVGGRDNVIVSLGIRMHGWGSMSSSMRSRIRSSSSFFLLQTSVSCVYMSCTCVFSQTYMSSKACV